MLTTNLAIFKKNKHKSKMAAKIVKIDQIELKIYVYRGIFIGSLITNMCKRFLKFEMDIPR